MLMIGKLGLRRILPILFTVLHVSLLIYREHRQTRAFRARQEVYHLAAFQEDAGPAWTPDPRLLTPAQKIALLLNLPSLVLGIPVATTFRRGRDLGLLYAALPFVPIIWYGIGRWIDSMLGYVRQRWRLPRSLSGFLATLSMGWLVLSASTLTPINHHRSPDTYWTGTALIFWSGLSLAMSLSSFYRRPRQLP